MSEMIYLPVDRLHPHPDNPRKDLGDLSELADSIKANGIFQNLTVVVDDPTSTISDFTVIIGHRRLAAAKMAGLTEVPCVIAEMDQREQVQTMLLENMQRSDLTVYEQAQGFQMMLNLGATVEEIAQKSGFSAATVRRRVKMTELDQAKLKEVSSRQITLGDFDELAKIEDIKERNKVLESIGTKEFEIELKRAMNKQLIKKNMPAVKAWLKKVGAKEISRNDTWSNKYEGYPGYSYYIYIAKWGEGENRPPKTLKDPVFYYIDSDSIRLFKKREKAKPERKSPAELARIRAVNEAWESLSATANLAYDLRKQFVEKLTVTAQNRADILTGALYGALLEGLCYNSPDRNVSGKIFGIDLDRYDNSRDEKLATGLDQLVWKDIPALVYSTFGDEAKVACTTSSYRSDFPVYGPSTKLTLIYKWLFSLGYQISAEEADLLNGTLAAYHAREAFSEKGASET